MKQEGNIFQKFFASIGFGVSGSRIPLRSNIVKGSGSTGYSKIGVTGRGGKLFGQDRTSPLLGNYSSSKSISSFLDKIAELKSYEMLDISKLSVSFFRDYVNNFISKTSSELVTILDDEGNPDDQKSKRLNEILTRDIKIFDFIEDHLDETIFYGAYYSMLRTKRDEQGHLRFFPYSLYDPVSVIIKKKLDKETNEIVEEYIARGEDGAAYVIPDTECFYLGSPNMRLNNDLKDEEEKKHKFPWEPKKTGRDLKFGDHKNREKVIQSTSYSVGEPLFYTNILKVKELVVKELLVSLLSLRDLCTPSILALMFDKGVPLENAEELCTKVQRMLSSYNDLSSFLTAQFDATSLIENILSQNIRVIPDFNATLQNKGLINTDKLGDKLMELMQTIDQSKQNVLSPLGIPASVLEGNIGSKWAILQSSERLQSRVFALMTGMKESVTNLIRTIYKLIYDEPLDSDKIKLHIFEKTTVEYNNSLNTLESISSILNGISGIITTALQTLETAMPLIDTKAFVVYIQNKLKDADPDTAELITEETIQQYVELMQAKYKMQLEQLGVG